MSNIVSEEIPRIIFRDRALKPGEQYHHCCENCGVELHQDLAQTHRCNKITYDKNPYKGHLKY